MDKCQICGEPIRVLVLKASELADGSIVCNRCINRANLSIKNQFKIKKLNIEDIREGIANSKKNGKDFLGFKASQKFGKAVHFDDKMEKLLTPGSLLASTDYKNFVDYKDIKNFELVEDGETITSGGLGRALAGGAVFGQTGAIVGAITGGKKEKGVCNSLKIKLDIVNHDDKYIPIVKYIHFIKNPVKKKYPDYKNAAQLAEQCVSKLQLICDSQKYEEQSNNINETEKILEYKSLLDQGIITEGEFEKKKKELLGL